MLRSNKMVSHKEGTSGKRETLLIKSTAGDSWTTVKTGCRVECKSYNLDDIQRRLQHLDRQRQESRKTPQTKKMLNEMVCSFCFSAAPLLRSF